MPVLLLDTIDSSASVSTTWEVDESGAMRHTPSGLRVSPDDGVEVDGQVYRLDPADIITDKHVLAGVGSGGRVYVGRHAPTGAAVAVKTIDAETREKREQVLREIKGLIQAAGCPYIVQWYAGFVDKGTGFVNVVMEYMDMGSLFDLWRRLGGAGLPPEYVQCVAAQIVLGLHHLQGRRMIHRDVKPQNVLLSRQGAVKLADFGISKEIQSSADVMRSFKGTAMYMSPERASGRNYSYCADIWSAGVVTYEMATGTQAFVGRSFIELWNGLCVDPEPRLDAMGYPAALCDFIARCLTRDEKMRPDARTLLEHEVVSTLSGEQIAQFGGFLATLTD